MHEKQEQPDQQLRELCKRAAQEQDTTRLKELVKEIIDRYDARQARLPKQAHIQPAPRT